MKRTVILLLLALTSGFALAQGEAISSDAKGTITVQSRGNDVRTVVHDLFSQVDKNYVLDPTVRIQPLYLSLRSVDFEEALFHICKLADLKYDLQNGIFYVSRIVKPTPTKTSDTKTSESKATGNSTASHEESKPAAKTEPAKGSYPSTVLSKRVTTRFDKIDLRELMSNLSKQTGLKIEVDTKVPKYRIDAYLMNTSLKYALDQITQAANLRYRLTDRFSIEIVANVAVSTDTGSKASH